MKEGKEIMKSVIKRDGITKESFDKEKIYSAIYRAMKYGSGIVNTELAEQIAEEIEEEFNAQDEDFSIKIIEDLVYKKLFDAGEVLTSKAYEGYRAQAEYQRVHNTIDEKIEGLIGGTDREVMDENSNKDANAASTQRDLTAGEFSRDYTRRKLLPTNIMQAHDEGILHFHDADYFYQKITNCCLINLKDMLENGTVINKTMIESPKSFATACTVATQIVQQISSGQYGGATITVSHLAPYLRVSLNKWKSIVKEEHEVIGISLTEEQINTIAKSRLHDELKSGVQTIQYQINTFNTSNGQAPFLTVFMYINEEPEYAEETAMIIEEILRQRITGTKNEKGVYTTPAFPKLIYATDEDNIEPESKYFYITKLAAECITKRMMPDLISAKIMRENYDGEVFPSMGCRSFLSPWIDPSTGKYKWYGRLNQGVVTINLPDVGLSAKGDIDKFWSILDERLELCKQALLIRHERLLGVNPNVAPVHWKYGAISRVKTSEEINELLNSPYTTLSLGYAGLYECVMALIGESHTAERGKKIGLEIMQHLVDTTERWKKEYNLGFGVYGTPLESTTYKLARCLKKRFGIVEGVTDHDYITNSYHVNVREPIDAYEKMKFEAEFQKLSSGGAVSYVEMGPMEDNVEAVYDLMKYMYNTIQYAEMNGKFDYCMDCGYSGEIECIEKDGDFVWTCPNCSNTNRDTLVVTRRSCGKRV